MSDWLIAVFVGALCGLVLGIKIARDSNKKQPVKGGPLAQTFHYLACAGITAVLPFVITGLVVGLPFVQLFGTAVGFLALTAAFLLLDVVVERSAGTPSAAR
jgi:hypothetical protein